VAGTLKKGQAATPVALDGGEALANGSFP